MNLIFNPMKNQLQRALKEFRRAAEARETGPDGFRKPIESIWQAAGKTNDGADIALKFLEPFLLESHIGVAGFTALCCGGLVETGGNPSITLSALMNRMPELLSNCEEFVHMCFHLDNRNIDYSMASDTIERRGGEVFNQNPNLAGSWSMLDLFGRSCVAHLISSKEGRKTYRNVTSLVDPLTRLSEVHEWANWVRKLLAVLDDEILIVIHPGSQRGYRVEISGVADNFQLHTLLADALIGDTRQGWLDGKKPGKDIVALAKGERIDGQDEAVAFGIFNMVGWRGLQPDLSLSNDHNHWIWGEGTPADIEPLNGTRIVLIGVCPYERSWNAQPPFTGLRAEVKVLEQLNDQSVQRWLKDITGNL